MSDSVNLVDILKSLKQSPSDEEAISEENVISEEDNLDYSNKTNFSNVSGNFDVNADVDFNRNKNPRTENKNYVMCRMFNLHIKNFFDDNIYIPIGFFRNGDWKVSKILFDNEDALFYNKKYLPDEDDQQFHEVFTKYVTIIEEIMSPNNKLFEVMTGWTDRAGSKWRSINKNFYLKNIIAEYDKISPLFIVNLFSELKEKYPDDGSTIKKEFQQTLNEIMVDVKSEIRSFRKIFKEIVMMYVYEYPIDSNDDTHIKGLINSIILSIITFADRLLDLNVYAIHAIVNNIIDNFLPLDEINLYDPTKYQGRPYCIV